MHFFAPCARENAQLNLLRYLQGHLREIPFEVRVLISKRHPRDKHPKYLMTTDLMLSVSKVLKGFAKRWSIEVEYWTIKEQLGLADFRMWSYQAIERWYTLVYFVLAFLSWRSRQSGHSLSQVLHQHRSRMRERCWSRPVKRFGRRETLTGSCRATSGKPRKFS